MQFKTEITPQSGYGRALDCPWFDFDSTFKTEITQQLVKPKLFLTLFPLDRDTFYYCDGVSWDKV